MKDETKWNWIVKNTEEHETYTYVDMKWMWQVQKPKRKQNETIHIHTNACGILQRNSYTYAQPDTYMNVFIVVNSSKNKTFIYIEDWTYTAQDWDSHIKWEKNVCASVGCMKLLESFASISTNSIIYMYISILCAHVRKIPNKRSEC